ncbi:MAG: RecX family transcriptional regulator [Bacteroidetes bacterium]|nr:RecX family transcriptional regulator [Bacteroidota bacterium]
MELLPSISRYCAYQERCHQEVRNKLLELGVRFEALENQIALLIEQDLLNEERFARAFARGKFRIKKWGRVKITQELRLRQISPFLITRALSEINTNDYYGVLEQLASRKLESLEREYNDFKKYQKAFRFLLQKGYEAQLVNEVLKELMA